MPTAAALLAENATPPPALLGISVFVFFMVLLFLVTRLNKDR
jgi:hypothetical protein